MIIENVASNELRRNIDELIVRYELEPSIKDLFVEGPFDRRIYATFINQLGYDDVVVYEIGTVFIPNELLHRHGLMGGNRSRIIAFSLELDTHLSMSDLQIRCIVDSDFDFLFDNRILSEHLLYTDYTSVDLYAYSSGFLNDVLGEHFPELDFQILLDSMSPILSELFFIRAANEKLGWGMTLPQFTRCCEPSRNSIHLDRNELITRYLNSSARMDDQEIFESTCDELATVNLSDVRKCILGSDFFELFGWYLHHEHGWNGYERGKRSILSLLNLDVEISHFSNERLFSYLAEYYGRD